MMNIILFDDNGWDNLLPLTYTRPASELRIGIMTIKEKWEKWLDGSASHITQEHLSEKFKLKKAKDNILINGRVCPSADLVEKVKALGQGEAICSKGALIALRTHSGGVANFDISIISGKETKIDATVIRYPWDIFSNNGVELESDFTLLTEGRKSQKISSTNTIVGDGKIFIEKGAKAEASILSTVNGSIYIGKDSEVMEGAVIRGPFALCEHGGVKMGAKIYGPTTVGPHSKVGGEVNNSVIIGYSNKGHDGFLGNSVIGEWCNLGADTNNSNLKNNYGLVDCWNYPAKAYIDTGLQFCGLIMGDHSKTGINTMLNTGTVVGVSCNIYGSDFPRKFVPSFSWGSARSMLNYKLDKALETAERVMDRRSVKLDKTEQDLLESVFKLTDGQRK
ncbi:MAG: UDP-N-acetylglucosamine diphosphorylase/glucosamine-1-phosphate N-acetyltransferase [Bacteroidia bacterium]|jgi:UDP-N-acetylglucosamine diphosphorylase/glucosamine-1-phosphate N-acetyltransferase